MFLSRLSQAAEVQCRLVGDRPVLVGVSGGADSLALMLGLHLLGYQLVIAHLDHAIRPDSSQDAVFVRQLAASFDLPFEMRRVDVHQAAQKNHQSLEESARHARYQFLFDCARGHTAQAVAVAHHADDQVETVLMHLLRGAGLSGLSGMAYRRVLPIWDDEIPLVRPLLGHWRAEIDAFVAEHYLEPRQDETNQDTTYYRNRLRQELIPSLTAYNPRIRQTLWRMADVLRVDDACLSAMTQKAWERSLLFSREDCLALDAKIMLSLDRALQRRLIRRTVGFLRPDLRDLSLELVEDALSFIALPSRSGEMDFLAHLKLVRVGEQCLILDQDAPFPNLGYFLLPDADYEVAFDPGEIVCPASDWCLQAMVFQTPPSEKPWLSENPAEMTAWLDADQLAGSYLMRARQPGDRFQPLGMPGHTQKIKDLFINEKIPSQVRDRWPLICSQNEIIWVPGIRPSERCKLTKDTQRVLQMKIIPSSP
jgi:tRNA(Ile)-lysidine synthase